MEAPAGLIGSAGCYCWGSGRSHCCCHWYQPLYAQTLHYWSPTPSLLARDTQCHLLCDQEWLSVESVASRLPALEDGVSLLSVVAHQRYLGKAQHCFARTIARENGT